MNDGSSVPVPADCTGHPGGVPGSWLHLGLSLVVADIWESEIAVELCVSLILFFKLRGKRDYMKFRKRESIFSPWFEKQSGRWFSFVVSFRV